jgi:short-subunit dehydrogenase
MMASNGGDMRRFSGKRVVITGASAGIGESAARLFAAEGARVVLVARRVEPLRALADELIGDGCEAVVISADVGDADACRDMIATAAETFGGIDVLVNNAGAHFRGDFESRTAEQFATMVDVNLKGPIVLSRHAVEIMRRQGRGTIVHVASIAGRVPLPGAAVYSATKFGLRAFSLALAEELRGTGIAMSVISPGPVETGFILDELETVSPLALSQPMSTAEDIAGLVLQAALDGRPEYVAPVSSGRLATLGYVMPGLARLLRPIMARRGERARKRYALRGKDAERPG